MNSIFIIKLANKHRCELCNYTTNYDKELNAHKKTHKQKKLEKFVAKKLPPNSSMYSMAKSAYRLSMNTSSKFRTLPDFLIFGESKCGTNSLCANLIEHQSIFLMLHLIMVLDGTNNTFHQNGRKRINLMANLVPILIIHIQQKEFSVLYLT